MKKILALLALVSTLASSVHAEFLEPDIIEETALYKIYCINNTAWLKWNNSNTIPVQMFKANYTSTPQECKQ